MGIPVRKKILLLVWWIVGAAPTLGQETPKTEGRKIVATGTVTVFVAPDAARLTFAVTTTEGTEKSIREANASHVKRIKDGLVALELDQSLLEMHALPSTISTIVSAAQNPMAVRVPQSKRAQSIFQVIVRDKNLDKLRSAVAKIAETAADLGATGIEPENPLRTIRLPRQLGAPGDETETVAGPSIEWIAFAAGDARRTAIRRAFEDAQADAQAIAGSAKLTIVDVTVTSPEELLLLRRLRGETGATENALIPIRVQVRVTCSY